MARILDITESFDQPRLKIYFQMESENVAEWYAASYLMSVREKWMLLDLYYKKFGSGRQVLTKNPYAFII